MEYKLRSNLSSNFCASAKPSGPLMMAVRRGENRSPILIAGDQRCTFNNRTPAPNANRSGTTSTCRARRRHDLPFFRSRWRASSMSLNISRPSASDREINQRGNGSAFSAGGAGKPNAIATSICQKRLPGANKRNSQIPDVSNAHVKSQHSSKPFSSSNLCLTKPLSGPKHIGIQFAEQILFQFLRKRKTVWASYGDR